MGGNSKAYHTYRPILTLFWCNWMCASKKERTTRVGVFERNSIPPLKHTTSGPAITRLSRIKYATHLWWTMIYAPQRFLAISVNNKSRASFEAIGTGIWDRLKVWQLRAETCKLQITISLIDKWQCARHCVKCGKVFAEWVWTCSWIYQLQYFGWVFWRKWSQYWSKLTFIINTIIYFYGMWFQLASLRVAPVIPGRRLLSLRSFAIFNNSHSIRLVSSTWHRI